MMKPNRKQIKNGTNEKLRVWVAVHVMGYRTTGIHCCLGIWAKVIKKDKQSDYFAWHPTESISDTFQMVEKMMQKYPDWFFTLDVFGDNYKAKEIVATFQESAEGYIIHACQGAETAPLAICLAAKEAVEAQ